MGRRDLTMCGWTQMDANSARGKWGSQGRVSGKTPPALSFRLQRPSHAAYRVKSPKVSALSNQRNLNNTIQANNFNTGSVWVKDAWGPGSAFNVVVCLAYHSSRSAAYDVPHRSVTPFRLSFSTVAALNLSNWLASPWKYAVPSSFPQSLYWRLVPSSPRGSAVSTASIWCQLFSARPYTQASFRLTRQLVIPRVFLPNGHAVFAPTSIVLLT